MGWIERVRWSPDGSRLASALGKNLFILKPDGEIAATFSNHRTSVSDFSWNPNSPLEIASVCGGGARMWRIGETEPFARFDWGGASLLVLWSPDGRWLATGDQTPSVHLYDFTRDYPLHIQGYETKVKAMDFSPDGKRLATGGGTTVTVWNCTGETGPEGTVPDQLKFHKGDVEINRLVANGRIPRHGRHRRTHGLLRYEGTACLRFRGYGGDQRARVESGRQIPGRGRCGRPRGAF